MGLSLLGSEALVVALLVLAGCGGGQADRANQETAADSAAETARPLELSAGQIGARRFVPARQRQAHRAVLPVAFTDGTRAELVYPPDLGIAGLGVVPYGSATLRGKSPSAERGDLVARDLHILYGDVEEYLSSPNSVRPPSLLERYKGADGKSVGFWDLPHPKPNYLAFQFGRWAVLVYDYPAKGASGGAAMTRAERVAWSASLSGRETADGFILLKGARPLRLARAGQHAGPELSFGSIGGRRWFSLHPGRCKPDRDQRQLVHGKLVQWTPGFANRCLSDRMRIHARGRGRVIEALIRRLAVQNVALADG